MLRFKSSILVHYARAGPVASLSRMVESSKRHHYFGSAISCSHAADTAILWRRGTGRAYIDYGITSAGQLCVNMAVLM